MRTRHKRRWTSALEEANLVPIMSILVILVPMLLYSFNFFDVTVQGVGLPRTNPHGEKKARETLQITVAVSDAGFLVRADDVGASDEWRIPVVVDGQDYPALHNRLVALKAAHPGQERLHIAAEAHVPWRVIARVMDCGRLRLEGAPFEGDDARENYVTAPALRRRGEVQHLFSDVSFVVADY